MSKDLFLIPGYIQKSLRARVLEERNRSEKPGMSRYLLELYEPLQRSLYRSYFVEIKEEPSIISKWLFCPHSPQVYPETGPYQGTISCFRDEKGVTISSSDLGGEDRAILCVSEEQAQEYLRFLEKAKKTVYDPCIREDGKRSQCRIIKDLTLDHKKGYWLAELDPPALTKEGQEFSRVFFFLKDMPLPGQITNVDYILLREDEVEDFLGPRIKREYQSDEIGLPAPDYKI